MIEEGHEWQSLDYFNKGSPVYIVCCKKIYINNTKIKKCDEISSF